MSEAYNPQYRGRMENWTLVQIGVDYFRHPVYRLSGDIYGDVKGQFPDGTNVLTSNVRLVEGGIVYTKNSIYHLGAEAKLEPENNNGASN